MAKKYTETLPELDFRREIEKFLEDKNAKVIAEKIGMNPVNFSLFRNQKGGIHWQKLLKLIILMDYKIVHPSGRVALGNPERREQEIRDNTDNEVEVPLQPPKKGSKKKET